MQAAFWKWLNLGLMANLFLVLASFVWLALAVAGNAAHVPLGLALWYKLWNPLFTPAIGLLMGGALVSGLSSWVSNWRAKRQADRAADLMD
jgi:hypothetical protein